MNNFREKFKACKFGQFWLKAHLNYLLAALLLYAFKAGVYFLIAAISAKFMPGNITQFNMEIDKHIPFIPYFYFFYVSYYVLPELAIWFLSFSNKRKVFDLLIGAIIANILCFICFLIKNVQMDRSVGEAAIGDISFKAGNIKSFRDFWLACVRFQYDADKDALNCFPSLHAVFGTMLLMVGIPFSKKEPHFPLWARIICLVFGLGIIMSTFFIKQHYFIDTVAGVALMFGCYFLAKFIINKWLEKRQKKLEQAEQA